MGRKRFHNLVRPKIRADWSRWTLYNIHRMREPFVQKKTLFQQKWDAKKLTRAYHGEQIREGKWELMFDRRLPGVVPMDAKLLATSDGSEAGAGRGSGRDKLIPDETPERTPYSHMVYWPVERRLDTAVWRALFASSALQARQFVVHGWVKVNGKTIRHPSYLLNPGDMFQVDPERVMFATGRRKDDSRANAGTEERGGRSRGRRSRGIDVGGVEDEEGMDLGPSAERGTRTARKAEQAGEDNEVDGQSAETDAEEMQDPKEAVKALMFQAKDILKDPVEKSKMSAKQKQRMRAFAREARSTMSRIRGDTVKTSEGQASAQDTAEELEQAFAKLIGKEEANDISPAEDAKVLRSALDAADVDEGEEGDAAVEGEHANFTGFVRTADKPYYTPWTPRDYMSAFAFIPRYLEVHQKICSAVYLRHPVARPGLAEVPTPYSEGTYELVHNWYLRRR